MAERGLASPERATMQEELQRLFAFAERKLFARHMLGLLKMFGFRVPFSLIGRWSRTPDCGLTLLFCSIAVFAQSNDKSPSNSASMPITSASGNSQFDGDITGTIPPGTTITMQNWQQFKQYMPDGMASLFEGKYFWKMPADVSMEVGPTIIHPLVLPHR
jgi:hypothetical protein